MPDIKINLQKRTGQAISAGYIGSVSNVIQGSVPAALTTKRFQADKCLYGFELASPQSIESMGEAVIVNGYCYTTSTDSNSSRYGQTIHGSSYYTSGLFFIPRGALPSYTCQKVFIPPMTLESLFNDIYAEVKHPFFISGLFEFKFLECTAIAKAPIVNENIFENQALYYPNAPLQLKTVQVFLTGAVADFNSNIGLEKKLLDSLNVVLYHNPFEKKKHTLTTHSHGVTLCQPVKSIQEISPERVGKTIHVFSTTSFLSSMQAEIYLVGSMKNYGISDKT